MSSDERASSWMDAALTTGSLTTIATGGALIGLGMREGEASRVFRLAGRSLLESAGVSAGTSPLTSVAVGYLHHLLVASAWGTGLALLILPRRGVWRVLAAGTAAALYTWGSTLPIPSLLRIGCTVTSAPPSAVPIGIALSVALLGGVWLDATDPER